MEFFRDTKIDFMRYRRICLALSVILLIGTFVMVFVKDTLNLGIDFAGGTQLTVKFEEPQSADDLRALLAANNIDDALVQRFGDPADNSVLIKTPLSEGAEEGSRAAIVASLEQRFPADGGLDLNQAGAQSIASWLLERDPDGLAANDPDLAASYYDNVAAEMGIVKKELGLIVSWDQLGDAVSPEVAQALASEGTLGSFSVLGAENVSPQIGSELRRRSFYAMGWALLGMLAYIWVRFELRYGVGAVVAVTHDVLITLGLFAVAGYEFNLTTIAGFLTLVGYSVNDSVVVFDRVRENLRQNRRGSPVDVMNTSLNQTLSRTVLTSGTTLLVVGSLYFFGGDILRGFAFILSIGVLVGTYSSIYVASPFALLWERWFGREARSNRRAA